MAERAQMPAESTAGAAIQIRPAEFASIFRLKSWVPGHGGDGGPVLLAGKKLPSQVGETSSGSMRVLCVGPADWLIVSQEHHVPGLRDQIEQELPKQGFVLSDLTDGLAALELRGASARDLLSKDCGLDLHPRMFPAGRCVRTRFAQIPVVIECLESPARFELFVARSYVRYLDSCLTDAALEYLVT
jgi:sarcosine oxidase, subunit gamma